MQMEVEAASLLIPQHSRVSRIVDTKLTGGRGSAPHHAEEQAALLLGLDFFNSFLREENKI